MRILSSNPELSALLGTYDSVGGALDFVFFGPHTISDASHRLAALAGMAEIARRHETRVYRIHWDEAKLAGNPVTFPEFWGSDDAEPKPLGELAESIPEVDGYKTAFFLPPHGLSGGSSENDALFVKLNRFVFGSNPERIEIFSWSTDWSNYFDAGHEWWGDFFWTIRQAESDQFVVIAASTTD
jgi:hypothetical protein